MYWKAYYTSINKFNINLYDVEIALIYRALVTNAVSPKLGYAKRLPENNTGTKNDSIADPEHSS